MVWFGVLIFGIVSDVIGWIYYKFEYKLILSTIIPFWIYMLFVEWKYVSDNNFIYNPDKVVYLFKNGMCLEGILMYPCVPVFVLIIHNLVNKIK